MLNFIKKVVFILLKIFWNFLVLSCISIGKLLSLILYPILQVLDWIVNGLAGLIFILAGFTASGLLTFGYILGWKNGNFKNGYFSDISNSTYYYTIGDHIQIILLILALAILPWLLHGLISKLIEVLDDKNYFFLKFVPFSIFTIRLSSKGEGAHKFFNFRWSLRPTHIEQFTFYEKAEGKSYSDDTSQDSSDSSSSYSYSSSSGSAGGSSSRADDGADPSIWFKGVTNAEELKKRYRDLLKIYHPDNSAGDTTITQQIQSEYDKILAEKCWG